MCFFRKGLENQTPFQCLFGKKSDISHLKVFGCLSYVLVLSGQRRKLHARARKAIFVGYPDGVKGYKLYDIERKKFITSRDVQFYEENFVHADKSANTYIKEQTLNKKFSDLYVQKPSTSEVPTVQVDPELEDPERQIEEAEPPAAPLEAVEDEVVIQNAEAVGAQAPVLNLRERRTYVDVFLENVQNLGPVRQ